MEPLFLDSPMHEKSGEVIDLRQSLVTIFPVNILVNAGQFLPILMVYPMSKTGSMLVSTWQNFTRINQNFLEIPRLVFFLC